ncbi:MAG: hypothetical protein JJU45_11215 [Acidimicrobiia bacterium]|nr:hypothetical protein [Acidimicrobiia bacterium]
MLRSRRSKGSAPEGVARDTTEDDHDDEPADENNGSDRYSSSYASLSR